ncbi:hypothetical protein HYFRA_00002764 [Hymenoscyphus fraxineus]|uniref:Alpha/beta-hydrolase n=1 Tax=Hymenoscyphus fraxineus TaxID=746836 RepID=A0A9N9PL07_9HELO|nr:hypothetical protein HYFRA_00002764 [Hymenoscyphus fraxineus]
MSTKEMHPRDPFPGGDSSGTGDSTYSYDLVILRCSLATPCPMRGKEVKKSYHFPDVSPQIHIFAPTYPFTTHDPNSHETLLPSTLNHGSLKTDKETCTMATSEKTPLLRPALSKDGGKWGEKIRVRRAIIVVLLGLGFLRVIWLLFWDPVLIYEKVKGGSIGKDVERWHWSKAHAEKELRWHTCYDGNYDCAKLDVPLDWLDPSDAYRASIAVIRFNATNKKNYKGSLFINPGGPGGSGIWFVKNLARYYQAIAGKNFDIISFDPRGVGHSTPQISCFSTPQSTLLWNSLSLPVLEEAYPEALHSAYAHAQAFSQQCLLTSTTSPSSSPFHNNTSQLNPLSYVSTASTARDMHELMSQLKLDKIKYWGFSYGTYLGLTFASLFPEAVERMVLDGNVEAEEYTSSRATTFIIDTEKIMTAFFHYCYLVGEDGCAFFASSEEIIQLRLDNLLERLKRHPVVVVGTENSLTPAIITYSSVKRLITSVLYRPILLFPTLAKILSALEQGDGEPYLKFIPPISQDSFQCPTGPLGGEEEDMEGSQDATLAIMCSDNGGVSESVDAYGEYVDELRGIAPMIGSTMAEMRLGCVGWGAQAKWRFTGPFEAPNGTSTPILFVANTADNVTPLKSAQRNSAGFPGSEILVQDAYGHTSLSSPSRCTAKAIKSYFQNATLPSPSTVCRSDLLPFEPWWDVSKISSHKLAVGISEERDEEVELNEALWTLMKSGYW